MSTVFPSAVHTFGDDALGELDAVGVATALRSGEVSVPDVVEAAIARCQLIDPHLTAIEYPDHERARARAAQLRLEDDHRQLAGVPTAFKDNVEVAGLPMTEGSLAVNPGPRTRNGKITQQFLDTGMVPIATIRMPEFGWIPTTERADGSLTRNPWNPRYSSGGSSGGSAALVAAGALPLAHGNDGGGSIRIPAGACGLVGLKPSRGRLRPGEAAMPVEIVHHGVLTRSVRDTATFFAEAEKVWRNPGMPSLAETVGPTSRRLRIGLLLDSPLTRPTDAPTRAAVESLAADLATWGHHVEPFALAVPAQFEQDFVAYWSFLAMMTDRFGPAVMGRGFDRGALDPMTLGLSAQGRRELRRFPGYVRRLRGSQTWFTEAMGDLDVVLSPTVTALTPRLGQLLSGTDFDQVFDQVVEHTGFTPLHNATGTPALTLPAGLVGAHLPVGAMFSARMGQDRLLLELAAQIEQRRPFPRIQDAGPAFGLAQ